MGLALKCLAVPRVGLDPKKSEGTNMRAKPFLFSYVGHSIKAGRIWISKDHRLRLGDPLSGQWAYIETPIALPSSTCLLLVSGGNVLCSGLSKIKLQMPTCGVIATTHPEQNPQKLIPTAKP